MHCPTRELWPTQARATVLSIHKFLLFLWQKIPPSCLVPWLRSSKRGLGEIGRVFIAEQCVHAGHTEQHPLHCLRSHVWFEFSYLLCTDSMLRNRPAWLRVVGLALLCTVDMMKAGSMSSGSDGICRRRAQGIDFEFATDEKCSIRPRCIRDHHARQWWSWESGVSNTNIELPVIWNVHVSPDFCKRKSFSTVLDAAVLCHAPH